MSHDYTTEREENVSWRTSVEAAVQIDPIDCLDCFYSGPDSLPQRERSLQPDSGCKRRFARGLANNLLGEGGQQPGLFNVDGTGFLVGRQVYFITAAHVLARYKPNSGQLTATFHQRDKSGTGLWFEVVETEENRDLALCKIRNFNVAKEPPRKPSAERPWASYRRVTSLTISETPASPGELIAIIGFPLGSLISPVVQMGNIGATDGMLAVIPPFPAGRNDLLIVSVSGNDGDSGCPVISLLTGEVVGLIDQYVPTPLLTLQNGQSIPQQSGLMVAIPSQWILNILDRHGIDMAPIAFKEDMVF